MNFRMIWCSQYMHVVLLAIFSQIVHAFMHHEIVHFNIISGALFTLQILLSLSDTHICTDINYRLAANSLIRWHGVAHMHVSCPDILG